MYLFSCEKAQVGISILLLIVLAGVMAGGIYMLDSLGLLHVEEQFYSQVQSIPYVGEYLIAPPVAPEEFQLDRLREREKKLEEVKATLSQKRKALKQRRKELQAKQADIQQREQELETRERALLDRRRRFEQREQRIDYLADLYGNMRPADAAERLQAIPQDRIVVGVLQSMEQAGASILLSNMDTERAAVISRKMAQFPPGEVQ